MASGRPDAERESRRASSRLASESEMRSGAGTMLPGAAQARAQETTEDGAAAEPGSEPEPGPDAQLILAPRDPVLSPLVDEYAFDALILNFLPTSAWPWVPDWVALVLVFWSIREPRRVGMGAGFLLGVAMDVADVSLLGQHAA